MSDKTEVSLKGLVDAHKLASYLTDLANSIKKGSIFIEYGQENISLKPEGFMLLELEAEQKKNKEKIVIEISWKKGDNSSENLDLKITAQTPND